ncbi:spermatogenesis-associated serine-rich protein 2 isoform X2 [Patagioenas fasciata]|uniref:spermatogenesis-associated serine-rich protein 2 isoform X2 n=1 Tax=Patagioenas fasciata TaxID=372321 RepID=UPI003A99E210
MTGWKRMRAGLAWPSPFHWRIPPGGRAQARRPRATIGFRAVGCVSIGWRRLRAPAGPRPPPPLPGASRRPEVRGGPAGTADPSGFIFDVQSNTVMAQGGTFENMKEKISAVRAIVPNRSNNEIVLVLQHFDNCVDRTVQAFMEGNASEVLKEWTVTGKKKNKKKKTKAKPQAEPSSGSDPTKPAPAEEEQPARSERAGVNGFHVNGCAHDAESADSLSEGLDALSIDARELEDCDVPERTAVPDLANGIADSDPKSLTIHPSQSPSSLRQQRNPPRPPSRPATAPPPGARLEDAPVSPANRKLGSSIEKSVKDLQRCSVSLARYRAVLKDEMDASIKKMKQVFTELQSSLMDREVALLAEMDKVKAEATFCERAQVRRGAGPGGAVQLRPGGAETEHRSLRACFPPQEQLLHALALQLGHRRGPPRAPPRHHQRPQRHQEATGPLGGGQRRPPPSPAAPRGDKETPSGTQTPASHRPPRPAPAPGPGPPGPPPAGAAPAQTSRQVLSPGGAARTRLHCDGGATGALLCLSPPCSPHTGGVQPPHLVPFSPQKITFICKEKICWPKVEPEGPCSVAAVAPSPSRSSTGGPGCPPKGALSRTSCCLLRISLFSLESLYFIQNLFILFYSIPCPPSSSSSPLTSSAGNEHGGPRPQFKGARCCPPRPPLLSHMGYFFFPSLIKLFLNQLTN